MRRIKIKNDTLLGYGLIIPVIIVIFVIIGIPFVDSLYLSLTDKVVGNTPKFIGFKNYISIFKDPDYWLVLKNTIVYTVTSVGFKLVLGIILALVLNEKFLGRTFVRTALLLPWALSGMVAAMTWKWMYNDTYGIINAILMRMNLVHAPVQWLSDVNIVLFSCIIVNIWRGVPFFIFSLLGGLQVIDTQIYEAAEIDGASWIKQFFYITVPTLSPVIGITVLLSSIWTFNDFENIYLITGGGPMHASSVISTYTYEIAFLQNSMGRAMSVAGSIIPILILMIIIPMRKLHSED